MFIKTNTSTPIQSLSNFSLKARSWGITVLDDRLLSRSDDYEHSYKCSLVSISKCVLTVLVNEPGVMSHDNEITPHQSVTICLSYTSIFCYWVEGISPHHILFVHKAFNEFNEVTSPHHKQFIHMEFNKLNSFVHITICLYTKHSMN